MTKSSTRPSSTAAMAARELGDLRDPLEGLRVPEVHLQAHADEGDGWSSAGARCLVLR